MKIFKDINKKIEILTINDWLNYCPPMNPKKQWVDYRSAKEMANFWTQSKNQETFLSYIQTIKNDLKFQCAIPEFITKFDNYDNPRKNDLCIFAEDKSGNVLISIEGKSDEPFGDKYVNQALISSIITKKSNSKSKKFDRLCELYQRYNQNTDFFKIRYQLSYWFAGTIDEAFRNNVNSVFLIVQEFHSFKTNQDKIKTNKDDFDFFVKFITNSEYKKINYKNIIGPINNEFTKNIDLYIGKYLIELK